MDGYVNRQALQDIADAIREKNGSEETYKPSEMAEAIRGIEGGGEGFDLVKMFGKEPEFSKYINNGILESLNYTETLLAQKKDATSWASAMKRILYVDIPMNQVINMANAFQYNYSLLYLSDLNLENATNTTNAFRECRIPHLGYVNIPKATNASYMFLGCQVGEIENEVVVNFGWKKDTDTLCSAEGMFQNLKLNIDKLVIEGDRCKNFGSVNINASSSINEFYALNSENCVNISHISWNTRIKRIFLGSVENCTTFANFNNNQNLEIVQMSRWKQTNLSTNSRSLLPSSIHYIIQNAMSLAEGATARTLTLNATAKTNWQNSEYYEQDLAVLTDKGITIA
jgi:hypothetical protein